jgi:hypothetical protein
MDDTPVDSLLSDLEESDSADAPDVADAVADRLTQALEDEEPGADAPQA